MPFGRRKQFLSSDELKRRQERLKKVLAMSEKQDSSDWGAAMYRSCPGREASSTTREDEPLGGDVGVIVEQVVAQGAVPEAETLIPPPSAEDDENTDLEDDGDV